MRILNHTLACGGLVIILTTSLLGIIAGAQTPTPTATPSAAANSSPITPNPVTPPKVIAVEGHLELDTIIQVQIDHFDEWAQKNDPSKLVPYIDGLAIHGNFPAEIHASKNHVHFHLNITPENKQVWIDLLGEPHAMRKPVAFSVGLENQSPFDSVFDLNNPLPLTVISPPYGVIAFIVVSFTLVLLLWLAKKTNLIRDGGTRVPGQLRPYNLGRTQMAFWFFLIYASYVTIWLITNALDTITSSLLALMGISAGTALSEAMIDSSKMDTSTKQLQGLSAEKQSLEQNIPELQTQINSLTAKTALTADDTLNRDNLNKQLQSGRQRLAQVNEQLQTLTPAADRAVSQGFLHDILADAGGYSFHRFQIFAWTIVLGIIFISSVYNNLTMPEFSATLLGLMGLSSGTYIGFKFPEKS
ncbi:MAG TPA: hypothetical protein VE961_16130 [Pyrinomonadaceae bacterium]|nr:hypothetical protein [Pyrinomonadaceae bacterium]